MDPVIIEPQGDPARRAIPPKATEDRWTAADGWRIRRIDWRKQAAGPARGSLLFMPGRGDFYEKYLESLDHWSRQGWQVTASDWRGQAGSGRLGADPTTGHIDDFATWIDDLAGLWALWKEKTPAPHVLVAHSMGGHLALRALAERRIDPAAVVLSAPMLGLLPQFVPTTAKRLFARLMRRLGDPRRPAWKVSEKPGATLAARALLLTHDEGRYADEMWWRDARPELVMGPGSWGWVQSALESIAGLEDAGVLEAVRTPVLIVATSVDGLVSFRAIRHAAARLPHGELVVFGREARHELLRETDPVRDRVLASIDAFLEANAPARVPMGARTA